MSRKMWENADWCFVAGVDKVTSSFFEVWRQPYDEQDVPVVMANNLGVVVYGEEESLPPSLRRLVVSLRNSYEISRNNGIPQPNLTATHANLAAKAVGFSIFSELYELYD